jgi:hypothetical protein
LSKTLSTNSEILCQVRPALRPSISSNGDPIGLEAGDGSLPRFAITGVTEAGEARQGMKRSHCPCSLLCRRRLDGVASKTGARSRPHRNKREMAALGANKDGCGRQIRMNYSRFQSQ